MSSFRGFEKPALRRLWQAARRRIERLGRLGGRVSLSNLEEPERAAIADLLGLRILPPAETYTIRLAQLDKALRGSRVQLGLVDFLTELGGPVRNLPAERGALEDDWQAVLSSPTPRDLFAFQALVVEKEAWRADGTLRRLARGEGPQAGGLLLSNVVEVLKHLPASGVRLAVLASRALGDSHALDSGHRVPALVLRVLARHVEQSPPRTADERRDLWAQAGVECDDLSCDVLVHGMSPLGEGLLPRTLRAFAGEGEPLRLTLRQLMRSRMITLPGEPRIYVCENPAIVAMAAHRLGSGCPPMVCVAGNPSTAALRLLRPLVESGSELLYHGDFDWGGIRIANTLARSVGWTPWRFGTDSYRTVTARREDLPELHGRPIDATWDPELRPALEEIGVVVEEEAMAEDLLSDLKDS